MQPTIVKNVIDTIRSPVVAGQFYPANAQKLDALIHTYLDTAQIPTLAPVRAVIAPHAGYDCSGQVAAHSFKALQTLPPAPYTVYLLGPAHWLPVNGVGLTSATAFATPLGHVPVAQAAVAQLLALGDPYHLVDAAHVPEHCLEVELPFLQTVLSSFQIVPMLLDDAADPLQVGADLVHLIAADPHTLLVVSSDLSHFYPYTEAIRRDQVFLSGLVTGNMQVVGRGEACGLLPILSLLEVAQHRGWTPHCLAYGNSGDTCSPKSEVVGYGAVVYSEPPALPDHLTS